MIRRLSIAASVAFIALAAPASAVTVTTAFGNPDPGSPGETLLVDFESDSLPAGFSLTGDFAYATGTSGNAAAPAGDATRYLDTSSAIPSGMATLNTRNLRSISFYWGSIDTYNSVDVLLTNGNVFTIAGDALPPANGDQSAEQTNRRVFFTAGDGEVINGLRFKSTGVAFEVDDVFGSAVPEPQSWMLMISGFGLVGAAARRRRSVKEVVA